MTGLTMHVTGSTTNPGLELQSSFGIATVYTFLAINMCFITAEWAAVIFWIIEIDSAKLIQNRDELEPNDSTFHGRFILIVASIIAALSILTILLEIVANLALFSGLRQVNVRKVKISIIITTVLTLFSTVGIMCFGIMRLLGNWKYEGLILGLWITRILYNFLSNVVIWRLIKNPVSSPVDELGFVYL